MSLKWTTHSWNDLTKEQLYLILALRAEVFVVEQECAYLDPDDKDQEAQHLLMYNKSILVGYARIFLNLSPCVIGRVVIKESFRGKNLGRLLMEASINQVPVGKTIFISAQERLKAFYESLGFKQSKKGYLEDGIPHIPMTFCRNHATDQ